LTYNQSGRLKTLSNSGTVSDYLYDGNNLRVVKDSDGAITHYHYDLQGRLLAETDSGAAGPGMAIAAARSVISQDGDYAGTYAISDEIWLVYPSGVVFSWSGETFQLQGSFSPYYELPIRSGGLVFSLS